MSLRVVSPPARGRGLKHENPDLAEEDVKSPPARGRGLKLEKPVAMPLCRCRPPHGGVD